MTPLQACRASGSRLHAYHAGPQNHVTNKLRALQPCQGRPDDPQTTNGRANIGPSARDVNLSCQNGYGYQLRLGAIWIISMANNRAQAVRATRGGFLHVRRWV